MGDYKRSHSGVKYEKPLKGTSHAMGLVIDKQDNNCKIPAKQPNSGLRKGDGGYNLIENKEEVLVAGMGRSGRSVGDLSKGVCHKIVKVSGQSLLSLYRHKVDKKKK